MISTKEMDAVWADIVKAYRDTMLLTPRDTVDRILKERDYDVVVETFSAVTRLKKGDGRICRRNRAWMESIPVMPECYDWIDPANHRTYRLHGLDDIHTAHIDQLISELYELANKEVSS